MENSTYELQLTLEQVKAKVAQGEALERLYQNEDFKALVLEGYFEKKAVDIVRVTAMPMSEQQAQMHHNSMVGISALQSHFNAIFKDSAQAKEDLGEYNKALEEETANG